MHDIPLNETQRIFADKNHNLLFSHRRVALEHNEYHQFYEIICTFDIIKSNTFHISQSFKN